VYPSQVICAEEWPAARVLMFTPLSSSYLHHRHVWRDARSAAAASSAITLPPEASGWSSREKRLYKKKMKRDRQQKWLRDSRVKHDHSHISGSIAINLPPLQSLHDATASAAEEQKHADLSHDDVAAGHQSAAAADDDVDSDERDADVLGELWRAHLSRYSRGEVDAAGHSALLADSDDEAYVTMLNQRSAYTRYGYRN